MDARVIKQSRVEQNTGLFRLVFLYMATKRGKLIGFLQRLLSKIARLARQEPLLLRANSWKRTRVREFCMHTSTTPSYARTRCMLMESERCSPDICSSSAEKSIIRYLRHRGIVRGRPWRLIIRLR